MTDENGRIETLEECLSIQIDTNKKLCEHIENLIEGQYDLYCEITDLRDDVILLESMLNGNDRRIEWTTNVKKV